MSAHTALSPMAASSRRWRALEAAAASLACLGAIAYLWWGGCHFPREEWNEVRLAPAFALRHGIDLYPPLDGGPLSTWIYGPVGAAINLPATFAASAVAALEVAAALNLALLVLPLAVVVGLTPMPRSAGWPARALALAAAVLTLPEASLVFQVADHAAVACGLLSCWCLCGVAPSTRRLALAAALAVASVWAKQTSVFLPIAQVIYLGLERARPARYAAWLALFSAASLVLMSAAFDFRALWLNLIAIPARLPWGDVSAKLALRWPSLAGEIVLPLALAVWLRMRRRAEADDEAGRFLRCTSIVFVLLLPTGLLAFFKIGGDMNVLQSSYYLVPALIVWAAARPSPPASRALGSIVAVAALLALRAPNFATMPSRPQTDALAQAEQLAHAHPRALWFPFNPLVTFYSDGTLYHVEDGIATRHLAGYPLREAAFRRHLPPALSAVVYPARETRPFALQLLGDFNQRGTTGAWAIYERGPRR